MLPKHRSFTDSQDHVNFTAAVQASSTSENAPANGANVDKVLFKNLVEIVPLVESLMDRRANSSFTRRASMVYTPTPAQVKKVFESGGRKTVSAKKGRDHVDNVQKDNQGSSMRDFSNLSTTEASNIQKDRYELTLLREQVDELQRKLIAKEEALKSAEDAINQMKAGTASISELRCQVAEKEASIKSANSELYSTKIELADKQAALEKLEWESNMLNRKVEELQDDFVSKDLEITALMQIFEELATNGSAASPDTKIVSFPDFEQLPPVDQLDDIEMTKMEHARTRYLAAVAAAKDNPSDESLAVAAEARLSLQAFAF